MLGWRVVAGRGEQISVYSGDWQLAIVVRLQNSRERERNQTEKKV